MFKAITNFFGRKKKMKLENAEFVKVDRSSPEDLGFKIIEHSTHILEEKFNERFLRWCLNTGTHPEHKNAVKNFINFFCEKYNYHGIKRIVGYKNRAYYTCIVRKKYAA